MRIGVITGEYPPMPGGIADYTARLFASVARHGHQISIFTRRLVNPGQQDDILVQNKAGKTWGWCTLRQVNRWVQENQFDVISIQFQTAAYNMHPAIFWQAARIQHVPVIVTYHDLLTPYLFPKAHWFGLREQAVRKLAADADGIIVTNQEDSLAVIGNWQHPHVARIPIGINLDTAPPPGYSRVLQRARYQLDPGSILVSHFGILNESKGVLDLVEAAAILRETGCDVRLLMIGDRAGSNDPANIAYGQKVDRLIAERCLTPFVTWTGPVSDEEASACLYASDLSVLPYIDGASLRRTTLLATLAHGIPVITTTPRFDRDLLETAAAVIPPRSAEVLASAMAALIENPEKREQLARAGKALATHFNWDRIAQDTIAFYQSVCQTFQQTSNRPH
nr:glycosyltransferase family 4 protein [Anaerolineae bacterium]